MKKEYDLSIHLQELNILCVDKNDTNTNIYLKTFKSLFKEVIIANNPEDAIFIYDNTKIDIILTNQNFNGILGLEMINKIRLKNSEIPIILVSSFKDSKVLTKAIELKINHFIKEPLNQEELLSAVEGASKQLLAKIYIKQKHKEELHVLQNRVDYSDYQENLSFQKELKIIRNDYYYKYIKESQNNITIIDFLYNARDVISGDSYSARKLSENKSLIFLVDGMGKGISASISTMMAVTFLNRIIDDLQNQKKEIVLKKVLKKMIEDTQKILLEDEILSASFIIANIEEQTVEYATFSMPPILILDTNDKLISINSNNPPINAYKNSININKLSCKNIKKLLIYSDGLVENPIKNEETTYSKYIKEDFAQSITREDLRQKIIKRLAKQEDDISFILINNIHLKEQVAQCKIKSKLKNIETANNWFEKEISKICKNSHTEIKLTLAFNELLMNAHEHGNLGITSMQKHNLIKDDIYFEHLAKLESTCNKNIDVCIYKFQNIVEENYIICFIEDEGYGFDTKMLMEIFGINKSFNRRGILMSRNSTLGIYYNDKANKIAFIAKV